MREDSMFRATVLAPIPQLGAAVVIPTSGVGSLRDPLIAYFEGTDTSLGAAPVSVVPAGSKVLCASVATEAETVTHIVAVLSLYMDPMFDSFLQRMRSSDSSVPSPEKLATDFRLLEKLMPNGDHMWARNHTFGLDAGLLPGDCDIVDRRGLTGLHVGRSLTALYGGPLASVEVSSADARVDLTGSSVSCHTLLSESCSSDSLEVSNRAVSASEAFGMRSGNPFRQADDGEGAVPAAEGTLPLYRLQRLAGRPLSGEESLVVGFPEGSDRHGTGAEPPVLSKTRKSASGAVTAAAVSGLALVKTPLIPAVTQFGYGSQDLKDALELRVPFKPEKREDGEPAPEAPDEGREVDDAMLNRLADRLLSEDYSEKLIEVLASHGLGVTALPGKDDRPVPPGGTAEGAQSYPLPDSREIEDPVSGRKVRSYDSTSMIVQEPDGSICLCDGYGSEIRMSRGNIYISPALDLFVRPGRDVSVMAPRHQAYNSQGTCTINSSGSLHMRSVGDLLMAGATGGLGAVTLESLAQPGAEGSGLLLRSMGDMSATCSGDMYVGRNAHTGDTEGKVTSPQGSGAVIVDSGTNGAVYLHGRACTIDSQESVLGSFPERGKGSALLVGPSSIAMLTGSVAIPATVSMAPLKSACSVSLFRDGSPVSIPIGTGGSGSLAVGGSLLVGGNMLSNGAAVFTKGLAAKGVASTSQYCGVIPRKDWNDQFREQPVVPTSLPSKIGESTAALVREASGGVYQDRFLSERGFRFPSDYGVSMEIMPGMLWQALSDASGSAGECWKEPPFESPDGGVSACYPGYSIWKSARISFPGYEDRNLESGYVTNSTKWEPGK